MHSPALARLGGPCLLILAFPTLAWGQVSGTVIDSSSRLPVAGVKVSVQATAHADTTSAAGTFSLPGATGTGLIVVAAKKGFYYGSTLADSPATGVQVELEAVPQETSSTYEFVHHNVCAGCHPDQVEQWIDSPMARAGQNTWVYDIYNGTGTPGGMGGFVYTRDSHYATSNPESECASCHQPEPWIQTPFVALEDIDSLSQGALHGISCEVCHKIAHVDESMKNFPGIWPGAVTFTRPESTSTQVQYGVLGDVDFRLDTFMRPSYNPQIVAETCAACHQDKNDPDEDGDFEEENGVVSEPTYNEWVVTPYADPMSPMYASCVDCHMPSYGAIRVCSVAGPNRDPETIRHHRIEGTTAQYLDNAVTMTVDSQSIGPTLHAQVSITNDQTGHHVPTGVTIRNMILLVEAWRVEDGLPLTSTGTQVVHDLGGIGDPAQGYYAGLPGKYFSKVNHDSSGAGPTFFTDAAGIMFDNRIPALATDVTSYTFDVPPGGGSLEVRARLIYRRSFRFLVDAKSWTEDGQGLPLEDVLPPYYGHLMEEENSTTVVTGVDEIASFGEPVALHQNRPNPASGSTAIRFGLGQAGNARLTIYDLRGRHVVTVADGHRSGGLHTVVWDGRDERRMPVASGVYVYRLQSGEHDASKRLVWVR